MATIVCTFHQGALDPAAIRRLEQRLRGVYRSELRDDARVRVIVVDGYPLRSRVEIDAVGGVRSDGNRTPELIERLRQELRGAIAAAAGLSPAQVLVTLLGVPSSWVMEGGRIMPAPGEEDLAHGRS